MYTPDIMSHEGTLTLLGLLIIATPFLGFPYTWLMGIIPVLGFCVVALSVLLRARGMSETPEAPSAGAAHTDETHPAP